MTTVEVRIETVNGSMVTFSRVSENWVNLNQYERDDIISGWINEDKKTARPHYRLVMDIP